MFNPQLWVLVVDVAECVTATSCFLKESGWMHTPHQKVVWNAILGYRTVIIFTSVCMCWHAVGCLGQHECVCS